MEFAGARRAIGVPALGPPGEAELGGEVVVVDAPLGDGRQAAAAAENGGGDQGEDRRQRVDCATAVPGVGDLAEDFVQRTAGRLRGHGVTPSPTSYKPGRIRSLDF